MNMELGFTDVMKWLPKSTPHEREKAIRVYSVKGVEAYIIIGSILCEARDKEDWKKAKCNNMREWCENEIRLSYTQAFRMMTIWDKLKALIPQHFETIKHISFTNLYEVARVANLLKEPELIELMNNASVNTERGFKDNIRELEGKVPTDTCDHMRTEQWVKCLKCHKFIKI